MSPSTRTVSNQQRPLPRFRRVKGLIAALALLWLLSPLLLVLEKTALRTYRQYGGAVRRHATHCRYEPSCSLFGLRMLERRGFWRGNARIALRLGMCSPVGWVIDRFRDPAARTRAVGDPPDAAVGDAEPHRAESARAGKNCPEGRDGPGAGDHDSGPDTNASAPLPGT